MTALPPFQRLVDAHWRDVTRLAIALAGAGDADDVAQQAWLQAYAAYAGLRSARNLKGWLLTITARCAMDAHRRRQREPVASGVLPEPAAVPEPGVPDPELWRAVRRRLPERQRLAVVLRYVCDLDHVTIGRVLGTTSAASRRLVSDALGTLRGELARPGEDPDA
jgi:DNA-directed RNA polymerase specialized sigma24 family protein